jgi:hypothetical protein
MAKKISVLKHNTYQEKALGICLMCVFNGSTKGKKY